VNVKLQIINLNYVPYVLTKISSVPFGLDSRRWVYKKYKWTPQSI